MAAWAALASKPSACKLVLSVWRGACGKAFSKTRGTGGTGGEATARVEAGGGSARYRCKQKNSVFALVLLTLTNFRDRVTLA